MTTRRSRPDPELRALKRDIRRTEARLGALTRADAEADTARGEDLGAVRDALEEREAERPKPQGC